MIGTAAVAHVPLTAHVPYLERHLDRFVRIDEITYLVHREFKSLFGAVVTAASLAPAPRAAIDDIAHHPAVEYAVCEGQIPVDREIEADASERIQLSWRDADEQLGLLPRVALDIEGRKVLLFSDEVVAASSVSAVDR